MARALDIPTETDEAMAWLLDEHHAKAGMEPTEDRETQIWHLLVSLIEYCRKRGLDFDHHVDEAKAYFAENL